MELLCENTSFVADPLNVERLVGACEDSAAAAARSSLISKLPPETDSSLLDELSIAVREGGRDFHELHRRTLQRMLEELGGEDYKPYTSGKHSLLFSSQTLNKLLSGNSAEFATVFRERFGSIVTQLLKSKQS